MYYYKKEIKEVLQMLMKINTDKPLSHINKEIYGHFSEHLGRCIYDGFYVGENSEIPNKDGVRKDVIEALKEIKIPVLRWPGGCFAEEYHWRDGIGEKSDRPVRINNYWGGVEESNHFGTHDFFNLCEELDCEPYLAANMSGGTVEEMQSWVEYITYAGHSSLSDERRKNGRDKPWALKYIGIGNENWGGGGNMRPEYYADEYRKYQTFCKDFSGNHLKKIACGANGSDYNWTQKVIDSIKRSNPYGISLHHYAVPTGNWDKKGSAVSFDEAEYYSSLASALQMEEMVEKHAHIIHSLESKNNPIALIVDEWGVWCDVEEGTNPGFLFQQNSMRDAIVAALTLNIFNNHSDIVKMANLAQTVNVLQSVILTDGKDMVKTPTYYVFDMFKAHQENELIDCYCENETQAGIPCLSYSASKDTDGTVVITICNTSLSKQFNIDCLIDDNKIQNILSSNILTASKTDYNSFEEKYKVVPKEYNGCRFENGKLEIKIPPISIISLKIR